jgi:hypothetical protein
MLFKTRDARNRRDAEAEAARTERDRWAIRRFK